MYSIVQQGLIVSALHNHWLFTNPVIMYIHIQSIEPPLNFAKKVAHSFSFLRSLSRCLSFSYIIYLQERALYFDKQLKRIFQFELHPNC